MDDDFINWDDLDLENLLGDFTEDDYDGLSSESAEAGDGDGGHDVSTATATSAPRPTRTPNFCCPLCSKTYLSISGFRGHVIKKHDRPDLKAHKHKLGGPSENISSTAKVREDFTDQDLKDIVTKSLAEALKKIVSCPFRNSEHSVHGKKIVTIAKTVTPEDLTENLQAAFVKLIKCNCNGISLKHDFDSLMFSFQQLRSDDSILDTVIECICEVVPGPESSLVAQFVQVYLLQCLECVVENLKLNKTSESVSASKDLTEDDKLTLCYIAGYVLRVAPKKGPKSLRSEMVALCESHEGGETITEHSSWIEKVSRGGLKVPSERFLKLITQFEIVVRKYVDLERLQKTSLNRDFIVECVMSDFAVKMLWEKEKKDCMCLEAIVRLFVTIRGFAITKLLKRQMEKKRGKSKQGGKSFRKALKDMN